MAKSTLDMAGERHRLAVIETARCSPDMDRVKLKSARTETERSILDMAGERRKLAATRKAASIPATAGEKLR